MDLGVRCLLSNDEDEAVSLAKELNLLNQERRSIEKGMVSEALQLPDIKENNNYTISVLGCDWHEGVIGIVAGRLKEQFYAPQSPLPQRIMASVKAAGGRVIAYICETHST